MRVPAVTALALITVMGGCAPMPGTAGPADDSVSARQCFNVSQVSNFRQGRANQVFLRIGRSEVYELNAAGGCRDLDFANQLAVIPDLAGSAGSRLCTGEWARIIVPGSTAPGSVCRARVTRRLTTEEIAALPDNQRP